MKCLFLAAGYATRLYPLTENFPKPLLQVAGRPILDHLLDDIGLSGLVDGYAVVTNSKFAPHFRDWASKHSESISVVDDGTYANVDRLGAVRDIQFALDTLGFNDDLLIVAGDNLLDFSLSEFVKYAHSKDASCIMRYFEPDENRLHKCGVVEVASDDKVLGMQEKPSEPRSHWCCPPFYFYKNADISRIAEAIESGCGVDAPGSLAAWVADHSSLYAMEMPGRRYDIGTLDSYKAICEIWPDIMNK